MTGEPPIPPTEPEEPSSFRPSWVTPPAKKPHPLALGCMGIGTFLVAVLLFTVIGLASMSSRVWGFLIPLAIAAIVIGIFLDRKKHGPAPLLGAAVVGLSIATALFGLCYASMGSFKIQ
jgi:hypothetical protein